MRSVLSVLFRIGVSAALLWLVLYLSGLHEATGREAFLQRLTQGNLIVFAGSVLLGVVVNLASALKWHWLIQAKNLSVGFWRVFCYYVIGQFYNIFLPTSVGGDVVRAYQLGQFTNQRALSLATVFVERITGIVTLFALALAAFLTQLAVFGGWVIGLSLVFFLVALSVLIWLVIDARPFNWVRDRLTKKFPTLEAGFRKAQNVLDAVYGYREQPRHLAWAFVNSLVFYALAALNVLVAAWVFDFNVGWIDMFVATPIIMLMMNIPFSLGNIGLMEFAYVLIFSLLGYDPQLGLSVALLMRVKSLFDGALGACFQPFFVKMPAN